MEMIRFILGCIFIVAGLVIFAIEVYGNYRFGYVLNRMHSASIGDSFGIVLCLIGCVFFFGLSYTSLKIACVVVFLWFSSPVCSHIVAKLETETNEELEKECEVQQWTD